MSVVALRLVKMGELTYSYDSNFLDAVGKARRLVFGVPLGHILTARKEFCLCLLILCKEKQVEENDI
jgi:hypothetical protein